MDELDPKLLARFRADTIVDEFEETEPKFSKTLQLALTKLEKSRKRTLHLTVVLAAIATMPALALGLLYLSNIALIGDTPNFANNLAQPIGVLVLIGWIIYRRVRSTI